MDLDEEDPSVDKMPIEEEVVFHSKKLSRVNLIDTINPAGLIFAIATVGTGTVVGRADRVPFSTRD